MPVDPRELESGNRAAHNTGSAVYYVQFPGQHQGAPNEAQPQSRAGGYGTMNAGAAASSGAEEGAPPPRYEEAVANGKKNPGQDFNRF